jgi:endonuclease YncB( thermonuclease family)
MPLLLLIGALLIGAAVHAFAARVAPAEQVPGAAAEDHVEQVLPGRVQRVVDGDGVRVMLDSGPVTVRLYGIDAPELHAPRGREARKALQALVERREVELLPVSQDRYDRIVAVLLERGRSVNEALLQQGHAWAYRAHLGQLEGDDRYCRLEAEARAAGRGLWSQPPAQWLPPWIYRARARGERGERVASRDYSTETAEDCLAATRYRGREVRRDRSGLPALPVAGPGGDACPIKGNISSRGERIYHLPGSAYYAATRIDPDRGERWF